MASGSLHSDWEPSLPHTLTRRRCRAREVSGSPGHATNTDWSLSRRPSASSSTSSS